MLAVLQTRRCFGPFGFQFPCFAHGAFETRLQRYGLGLKQANQSLDRVEFLVRRLKGSGQRSFLRAMRGEELTQFDQGGAKLVQLRVQIPEMVAIVRHEKRG